jgi:NADPH:quinone reductase-like Zn-dependent oxidoreductase
MAGIRLDGSSNLNVLITAASGGVGTLYVQVCIPASYAAMTK